MANIGNKIQEALFKDTEHLISGTDITIPYLFDLDYFLENSQVVNKDIRDYLIELNDFRKIIDAIKEYKSIAKKVGKNVRLEFYTGYTDGLGFRSGLNCPLNIKVDNGIVYINIDILEDKQLKEFLGNYYKDTTIAKELEIAYKNSEAPLPRDDKGEVNVEESEKAMTKFNSLLSKYITLDFITNIIDQLIKYYSDILIELDSKYLGRDSELVIIIEKHNINR